MDINLFHSLEDEVICFKALDIGDVKDIHQYAADEEVSRFIGWNIMKTVEETRNFIETMIKREAAGTHLYSSIVLKATGKVIGTVMLFNFDQESKQSEVGYVLNKEYWGKGYGTKALCLLNEFAFSSLKLNKLHASVVEVNTGSSCVLLKNGYVLEGCLRDHYYIEDKFYHAFLYGIVQKDDREK